MQALLFKCSPDEGGGSGICGSLLPRTGQSFFGRLSPLSGAWKTGRQDSQWVGRGAERSLPGRGRHSQPERRTVTEVMQRVASVQRNRKIGCVAGARGKRMGVPHSPAQGPAGNLPSASKLHCPSSQGDRPEAPRTCTNQFSPIVCAMAVAPMGRVGEGQADLVQGLRGEDGRSGWASVSTGGRQTLRNGRQCP